MSCTIYHVQFTNERNGHVAGWSRKEIPIMNVMGHAAECEERNYHNERNCLCGGEERERNYHNERNGPAGFNMMYLLLRVLRAPKSNLICRGRGRPRPPTSLPHHGGLSPFVTHLPCCVIAACGVQGAGESQVSHYRLR